MAWEHRFWLPQIPCSNIEVVSWVFVLQNKDSHKSRQRKMHWWVCQRGIHIEIGGAFQIDLKYYLTTFLAFGLVEAGVLLIASIRC